MRPFAGERYRPPRPWTPRRPLWLRWPRFVLGRLVRLVFGVPLWGVCAIVTWLLEGVNGIAGWIEGGA